MLFPGNVSPRGKHAGAYDPSTSIGRKCLRLAIALVILFILSWPLLETFMLETEEKTLTSSDLPAGIGQLRIVYATDIHKGGLYTDGRLAALISHINACNADIVLLGGDYAADSQEAVAFFRQLSPIHSRYGVYAVLGNHDRTLPEANMTTLRREMQSAGVTPLINAVSRVRIGTGDIYIAGIDDVNTGWPDLSGVAARTRADDFVIFLSHSPEVIPDAHKCADMNGRRGWFDLGLFGHTHGGQIALIGQYLGIAKVPAQYEQGWIVENRINMLISRGVGTSVLPVRIGRRPQIHVITVKNK